MQEDNLKNKAAKSLLWSMGERVATQGSLFIISIVLARILTPEEYGILAILLVFVNLADILVTEGLGSCLIQKQNIKAIDYSTIFLAGLASSFVLYGVIFIFSDTIALFYGNESIGTYLEVLALRIPLSSLNAIQRAYVSKNFRFRDLFISSSLGSFIAGCAAIFLAVLGFGIYSLIAQQLLSVFLCSVILLINNHWIPGFSFSKKVFKELFPLGLEFSGASFINALYTNGRALLIGKFYSPVDLAFYNRGDQFPALLVSNLNSPIANVFFPIFSEVKTNNAHFKAIAKKSLQICMSIVFPLVFFLMATADDFVSLLLTDKWAECVPYLVVLCVFYLFQPVQTMNNQVLKAAGKASLCLKLELIKKIFCFALLIIAIPHGVMAVAISSAIAGFLSTLIGMLPNRKIINYGVLEQFKDVIKPLLCSGISAGCILFIDFSFDNVALVLSVQFLFGSLIYFVLSVLLKNDGIIYVLAETRKRYKGY